MPSYIMELFCSGVETLFGKALLFYNEEMIWVFWLVGAYGTEMPHTIRTYGKPHHSITQAVMAHLEYASPKRSLFEEEVDLVMQMLRSSNLRLGVRGDCQLPYTIEMSPYCKAEHIEKILDSDLAYRPLFLDEFM